MVKLASKDTTSKICLARSKGFLDLDQKLSYLPLGKMCLPNMQCLKNLVMAKQANMHTLLEPPCFGQMMVSISLFSPGVFMDPRRCYP